ncbi:hypothetical protein AYO44_02090 [Planctomycetaceae bacterium SCGC AG-212-F19]|nr:hypothetical protein AYO44_02090 [Planctomycetaceae bacterium SCGC AG-212-F19]
MVRLFFFGLVALALVVPVVVADDQKPQQNQQPTADQKDAGQQGKMEATILDVDREKGTIKVRLKDAQGKEIEKTFQLTGDIRYFDSTGKVAAVEIFRSGNQVLVLEREGKLKELHQKK